MTHRRVSSGAHVLASLATSLLLLSACTSDIEPGRRSPEPEQLSGKLIDALSEQLYQAITNQK